MAKKRTHKDETPAKSPEFRSTPFSALKGISVKSSEPEKPQRTKPEAAPPKPVPARIDNESMLFMEAMAGVHKLGGQALRRPAEVPVKKAAAAAAAAPVAGPDPTEKEAFESEIRRLKLDKTFVDEIPDDELKPLAVNRLRQLKRGVINVDRQLDLHGLTRDEALDALPHFLKSAAAHGEKAVLVITGKGNNSPVEPVLQQAVSGWLRERGKDLVVEFAPAPREMGGSGAFVVFLRSTAIERG